ncbi:MAG: methylated-DNA--[protein]-cysteine S-methyltransferase [Candidatus Marinimicrobia bacterium]|jgi:O-6-methylguanine DNA methyltransferase|nr:methylated-DNA--[protein]-cysteine S-methyltransferase [Candidatus Neomarinimicrobiota bacterium]MBT3676460.1 methylated-DNA--[protein]-cysteine S-methyltransferase [Candidatus Neomarinimicrobiota bacterium]MBT3762863.1 methylated-DNA--[protein]-cysteine S-methyltransferase [Candidatus Neomarinimicrobiota bacterium]MBT4067871.1 methylated-DNA--[protein]-cysteine S-methyltransferase [Candidatus Neomarinimicrobiota bacterium]MBT4269865.1 methylated-DNA--[protein]-cysteine S-methyltransferase [
MIQYTITDSPIGKLLISKSNKGITHILFEYQISQFESIIKKKFPDEIIVRNDTSLSKTVKQLNEYFSGERQVFNIELDLVMPPFHQKALNVVEMIPYGKTISYKDVAAHAGNIKAVRAAGSANANNPIPIVIPCHRVLATSGGLGGYGGGLKMKNYLLNLEGAL